MLATVEELVPEYILTGVRIIIAVLEGIASAIPQICAAARGIIMGFIGCLVENYLMLPRAGWQLIMKLTDGIRQKVGAVILIAGQLIGQFVSAIVRGAAGLIGAGARAIGGWISGVLSRIGEIITRGRTAVGNFLNGLRSRAGELLNTGLDAAGDFIRGITTGAAGLLSEGLRIAGDLIQGIVNGIGNGVSLVTDAIRDLASDTIGAIGSLFGIGSPSRVFHEIGGYLMEGLALGIDDHSAVIDSVDKMGNDVIASMTSSAEQMAKVFDGSGLVDINPTITPVLDLTMLQDQAKGITGLLASNPLDADLSFDQANVISANAQQQQEGESSSESTEPKQIIFEQNITAPTPLSPAEIYRATRSQITLAKRELEVA
jgi:phage-related protein